MELHSGLSSFASYGVKKQIPKLSSTRKRCTGVPLRRKGARQQQQVSGPQPRRWLQSCGRREERRKAWQEERDCLLCGSEKTWASPRHAPGEPLAKMTCWRNAWAGISWLCTASKCCHCQRTTGGRPWLWLEAARVRKSCPQLLSLQQCPLNPHKHCFKCSKNSTLRQTVINQGYIL